MKLAPIVRTEFTLTRQEILDQALQKSSSSSVKTDLLLYKSNKGKKSGPTWPLNKDNDVEMIGSKIQFESYLYKLCLSI